MCRGAAGHPESALHACAACASLPVHTTIGRTWSNNVRTPVTATKPLISHMFQHVTNTPQYPRPRNTQKQVAPAHFEFQLREPRGLPFAKALVKEAPRAFLICSPGGVANSSISQKPFQTPNCWWNFAPDSADPDSCMETGAAGLPFCV